MPAAGGSLQGVRAGEPVGTEPAPPALGPRLEPSLPHTLRDLCRLARGFGHEISHLFDLDALARRQVYDLELHRVELERAACPQRVQSDLQVAAAARQRPAALVVDDPPA